MYIEFHPYASMLHIFRKTYFDVSSSYVYFYFYQKNLFWYLLSKISIFHLLCVLNSIHAHHTSNVLQISCFCIYTSFGENEFPF